MRAGSAARQVAVAGRPSVSRDVADALAEHGVREAVRALASNDNADLSERALDFAVHRFGLAEDEVSALAYRQVLPLHITEQLIEIASETVREHLVSRHAIAPEIAVRLSQFARERATVDLIDQAAGQTDLAGFVSQLNARKALNASLLLRALARGRMTLFEHGLAELAQTPHQRAWLMVHDGGPLGLKALYDLSLIHI